MKGEIEKIYVQALRNDLPPNVFADQILHLFSVSGKSYSDELEELKRLAHEGLPSDCVAGWDEVKFCDFRQGDGNMCKWCSNYR